MKTVGIIGRAYRNYTKQPIFQTSDHVRRSLANYPDVAPISLLPTGDTIYCDLRKNRDPFTSADRAKLDHVLDFCDGFIAPGGANWFSFDSYIIQHAITHDKPLLAICAGFQCLCSLYADKARPKLGHIAGDTHHNNSHDYTHTNYIVTNTKLHHILNQTEIITNSVHHYKVDFRFNDLIVNAKSIDGIVEGVELPDKKFIIGIQWHPEYSNDTPSTKIFDEFVRNL